MGRQKNKINLGTLCFYCDESCHLENDYWHLLKEDERKALEALKSNKNNVF